MNPVLTRLMQGIQSSKWQMNTQIFIMKHKK